jgi:hypothetical protein
VRRGEERRGGDVRGRETGGGTDFPGEGNEVEEKYFVGEIHSVVASYYEEVRSDLGGGVGETGDGERFVVAGDLEPFEDFYTHHHHQCEGEEERRR